MFLLFFFFNDPATTEIYTLSLHDALPIYQERHKPVAGKLLRAVPRQVDEQLEEASDRKSTRLNSSHVKISYAVFCLKKKKKKFHNKIHEIIIHLFSYVHYISLHQRQFQHP